MAHIGRAASPERLSYAGEHVFKPVIARHGNRLAYTQDYFDRDIWRVQPGKPPQSFISSTREEYAAQDVTIAIDETPVGTFVEIEGGEEGILTIAKALGRTPSDFLLDSYRALFVKHREEFGLTGTNMVFSEE